MLGAVPSDGAAQRSRAPTKLKLALAVEEHKFSDGNLSTLRDDLAEKTSRVAEAKKSVVDTRELLKVTFTALSHERSTAATLVFDLDRAHKQRKVVDVEVRQCESTAAEEEQATAAVRERLRWMRQMSEALKTARVEAESGCSGGNKPACTMSSQYFREANEQEDRYCGELLPGLASCVARAAMFEVERPVLAGEAKQFRERAAVVDRDCQELSRRHETAKSELRQAEAASGELAARVAALRAKVAAAEEGYQRLQEEDFKLHAVIRTQQVGMSDLRSEIRGNVEALGPLVAEKIQRHHQAEQMHSQRLEELEVAGRRGLALLKRASEPPRPHPPFTAQAEAMMHPLTAPAALTVRDSLIPELGAQLADRSLELFFARPASQQVAAPCTPLQVRPRSSSTVTGTCSNGVAASASSPRAAPLGSSPPSAGALGELIASAASPSELVELAAARAASAAGRARPLTPRSSLAKIAAAVGEPPPLAPRVSSAGETPRPTSAAFRHPSRGAAPAPCFDFKLPELSFQHGVAQVLKGALGATSAVGVHATPRGLGQAGQLVVGRA